MSSSRFPSRRRRTRLCSLCRRQDHGDDSSVLSCGHPLPANSVGQFETIPSPPLDALPLTDNGVEYSSRRRRCQRIPSDSAICALCQKHKVPCIASAVPNTASKASRVRDASFGIATRPAQSQPASNGVLTSPHLEDASPHAVSLPQPSSHQGGPTSPHAIDYDATSDVVLPPAAVCFHLATLYFDYVHDQLHTLFQKPSFMTDMVMNKTPPVIMFAVVALSARSVCLETHCDAITFPDKRHRFSSHEFFAGISPRIRGVPYARKSASLFDPSDVSLQSIQAAVLLGACRIVEGDAPAESVYYGIACRMAQLLDLPHRVCFTRLEREINIRGTY